ncbi:hypothetical protein [Streptosporangium lutulentum]|uniref:SnoaL-like domain-containing protein n=1 Tax=Streptosporangium lutulentum TaxID=1461250 RepID=A0ABT9Q6L3_9ACTN|nr:hypothetical protein [Streptosporangium lutulentum]MDP9842400.1 hypothetical protein [Streptosporangium lutulentum]
MNDNDLLNDRRFVMVSSTASSVDPDGPTEFAYRESGGIIWGDYTGDTVVHGRFVGTRDGDRIELTYVHLTKKGDRVGGQSSSRIETLPDGRLNLVEEFQFAGDDTAHVSVCTEIL